MRTQERLVSTILVLVQNTDTRDTRDTRGQLATNLLTFLGWGCPLSIATATCLDNLKLCFWAQTGHCIPCEETTSLHTQRFPIFLRDYLSLWHPSCWYWTVWMHGWQNQCSLENLTSAKTDHLKRGRIAPGPEGWLLCQNLSVFIHKMSGRLYRLFSNWTEAHYMAPSLQVIIPNGWDLYLKCCHCHFSWVHCIMDSCVFSFVLLPTATQGGSWWPNCLFPLFGFLANYQFNVDLLATIHRALVRGRLVA